MVRAQEFMEDSELFLTLTSTFFRCYQKIFTPTEKGINMFLWVSKVWAYKSHSAFKQLYANVYSIFVKKTPFRIFTEYFVFLYTSHDKTYSSLINSPIKFENKS